MPWLGLFGRPADRVENGLLLAGLAQQGHKFVAVKAMVVDHVIDKCANQGFVVAECKGCRCRQQEGTQHKDGALQESVSH